MAIEKYISKLFLDALEPTCEIICFCGFLFWVILYCFTWRAFNVVEWKIFVLPTTFWCIGPNSIKEICFQGFLCWVVLHFVLRVVNEAKWNIYRKLFSNICDPTLWNKVAFMVFYVGLFSISSLGLSMMLSKTYIANYFRMTLEPTLWDKFVFVVFCGKHPMSHATLGRQLAKDRDRERFGKLSIWTHNLVLIANNLCFRQNSI
mgnify:CR=1 FL=1